MYEYSQIIKISIYSTQTCPKWNRETTAILINHIKSSQSKRTSLNRSLAAYGKSSHAPIEIISKAGNKNEEETKAKSEFSRVVIKEILIAKAMAEAFIKSNEKYNALNSISNQS